MPPGGRLSDIGAAVQRSAESAGFSVVREYTGHGIGRAMHEAPDVPNWVRPGKGRRLGPGQTYALQPMVCARRAYTALLDYPLTGVTAHRGLAPPPRPTHRLTHHRP